MKKKIFFRKMLVILIFFILLALAIIELSVKNASKKNYILDELNWDMSQDDVKVKLNTKTDSFLIEDTDNVIVFSQNLFDNECYTTYSFLNNRLNEISIKFIGDFDTMYLTIYKSITKYYIESRNNFQKKSIDNLIYCSWVDNNCSYEFTANQDSLEIYLNITSITLDN